MTCCTHVAEQMTDMRAAVNFISELEEILGKSLSDARRQKIWLSIVGMVHDMRFSIGEDLGSD